MTILRVDSAFQHLRMCKEFFRTLILDELKNEAVCWIAGGAIRDYFSKGKIESDIDIFFPTREQHEKASYYLRETKGLTPIYSENVSYDVRAWEMYDYKGYRLHLIGKYFFGSPRVTCENFDFTVCCAAVTTVSVYHHETFFIDLASKRLVINILPFPLSTFKRLQKYIQKGFLIDNGGFLEIATAIHNLPKNVFDDPAMNIFKFDQDGNCLSDSNRKL